MFPKVSIEQANKRKSLKMKKCLHSFQTGKMEEHIKHQFFQVGIPLLVKEGYHLLLDLLEHTCMFKTNLFVFICRH